MLRVGVLVAIQSLSAVLVVADAASSEHFADACAGDTCHEDDGAGLSLRQLRGELLLKSAEKHESAAAEESVQEFPSACDVSAWPDKDHGLVCGSCKVLVDRFDSYYGSCDAYCSKVGRRCTGAWEEHDDTCAVKHEMTCSQHISSSDAICECGAPLDQVPFTCGGNAHGKQCRFPFRYKGGTYSGCTSVDHWASWCSTDYDYSGSWASCDCGEAPPSPPAPPAVEVDGVWIERSLVADEGGSLGDHFNTDLDTCKRLCMATYPCKSFAWTAGWGGRCHLKDREITANDAAAYGAHTEPYRSYYLAPEVATFPHTGTCYGRARLGYGTHWSPWVPVNGAFPCHNAFFGGDPAPGQAKKCVCDHGCDDVPGWVDSTGDDCGWYGVDDRCQRYGHDYEKHGHTASTACCVCKGYRP